MVESQQPTCGQGIAEHGQLHERLAELVAAMAANMAAHLGTLRSGETSQPERKAYEGLFAKHWRLAEDLRALADEMAGYRDLPMAEHDIEKLSGPAVAGAFEAYIDAEQKLVELLSAWVARDQEMLTGRAQ